MRENVLVFIMDDQTPNTISQLGNPNIKTPTLDKLVKEGTYFSPYTTVPVCTPARGEFLTGCNAFQNGCDWFNRPINPEIELLPQVLSQQGYYCYHVGKWHNDGHPRDKGYHKVDRVFPHDSMINYCGHTVIYDEDGKITSGHSTEVIMEKAIEFLNKPPQDKPWFCYVALHSPHDPRIAPEPWNHMYDNNIPPLPENYMPEHPFDNGHMLIRDERLEAFPRKQSRIRKHLADYYSMITHHDYYIGKALEALDSSGQRERTLVVFTSDHGLAIGSHGLMGKENLYEHSARVPLIFQGPNIPKGRRVDKECLCGHYDFLPTLMDYLKLPIPKTAKGISYYDVLSGKSNTVRKTICAGYLECMRMARNERYKMIYYPHNGITQLFDVLDDPNETNNLLTSWRRYGESRGGISCLSKKNPIGTIDSKPEKTNNNQQLNPTYFPAVQKDKADSIVSELKEVLYMWQKEVNDPIIEEI